MIKVWDNKSHYRNGVFGVGQPDSFPERVRSGTKFTRVASCEDKFLKGKRDLKGERYE